MPSFSIDNMISIVPEAIMACLAMAVLMLDLFIQKQRRYLLGYISLLGVAVAAFETWSLRGLRLSTFSGMFVLDGYATFFKLIFYLAASLAILVSINYIKVEKIERGEYYG